MTERIAVGDLVQVVKERSCCPERTHWGAVFRVAIIDKGYYGCVYCGLSFANEVTCAWEEGRGGGCELYRLKRIPPLSELEGEKSETTISELGRQLLGMKEPA